MKKRESYQEFIERVEARKAGLREWFKREGWEGEERRVTLEIGCGHGHFLVGYGEGHREEYCIGLDILNDRIERAKRKRDRAELERVWFLKAEAREFLELMPEGIRIGKVYVLFPDPWPKNKHEDRRLVNRDFLSFLKMRCDEECEVYFRSDAMAYVDFVKGNIEGSGWKIEEEGGELDFELETVFQQKAEGYGTLKLKRVE